jgi:DNA-binding transcriptional LysR family regulator
MVVVQALVVAGLGVTTSPSLALRAHRAEGIEASELPGSHQHIYAATYGEPPDPPATAALPAALTEAAASIGAGPSPEARDLEGLPVSPVAGDETVE